MKRKLTLTGSILGIIGASLLVIIGTIGIIDGIYFYNYWGYSDGRLIFYIFLTTLAILSLIFNICSLLAWNKTKEQYRKKKGLIICGSIFDFICCAFIMIQFAILYLAVDMIIFSIVVLGLQCTAGILKLVDFGKENKTNIVQPQPQVQQVANTSEPKQVVNTSEQKQIADKVQAAEEFSKKMEKITALKNSGILTEEEFSKIKQSYIKEYIDEK